MLSSWWRTLVMKRMNRAARDRRVRLEAEALETRDTPAGIFAAAVPAGSPSVVAVFDAVTKQEKFTVNAFAGFTGGVNVAVGDVNGDGTADLITGAGPGGGAAVNVFDGVNGALLKTFTVGDDASRAGVSVAAADFDGDGRVEIVAGGSLNGQPIVQVLRFSDGTATQTFTPFSGVKGVSVAAGDFNGDGTPDVAAGAGPGGAPVVVVFNGKDGTVLLSQQVFESTFTGGVTLAAADLNGDNNTDVIVSARTLGGPRVTVLAGPTGAVIQNFFADNDALRNGVEAVGFDADANGKPDLVTTSSAGLKAFDGRNLAALAAPTTPGLPVAALYDTTPPVATVTSTATSPTKTSPIPFKVTFSEVVNGFSAAGVTATNGTVSNFVVVDSKTFTFDVAPTASGAVTASANANAAFDAAGNGNATASASVTFDNSGPTIQIAPLVTNNTTPTITGSVDDPAAKVVVSVGGQTINATVAANGNFSATVPTPLAPKTYDVTATATDKLGNTSTKTQPNGLVIDTTSPTPTVSSDAPEPTNKSPIPFKVTFDKDVIGFVATDLTVANGTVSGFTPVNGSTYTFNVIAGGPGAVMVSVAAGKVTDQAGNPNLASNTLTRTLDTVAPTIAINPLTTSNTTPTVTGTVNDPTAKVSVTIAGSTLAATVSGNTWSATVPTPLGDGQYTVDATATDPAGNSTPVTLANGLVIDTTPPNVQVSTNSPSPTNESPFSVKIQFDEPVTGLTASAINVTNGSASNLVPANTQAPAQTFTVDITPKGDGTVTITVPAGAAVDQVHLGNTVSNTISVISDRTAPTGTIDTASTGPITGTASDALTGVKKVDVTISNGTNFWSGAAFDSTQPFPLAATTSDNFAHWSFNFTGPNGTYQVTATVTDNAGNTFDVPATSVTVNH
jgi:hypothetical protein